MCRWVCYIAVPSKPVILEDILARPPHAITKQVNPQFQLETFLNADGFGIAWYTTLQNDFLNRNDLGPFPALYRTTNGQPHNDTTFHYLCANTSSNVILSHLRGASRPIATTNNHPFVFGRNSFMHNGYIEGFRQIRREMLNLMSPEFAFMIDGSTDSEHLAALYLSRLHEQPTSPDDPPPFIVIDGEKEIQERNFSAGQMLTALRLAISQVEELQAKVFREMRNNQLNICTTNGENLLALCYRTNPWTPPQSLFMSFTVSNKLNRRVLGRIYPDPPTQPDDAATIFNENVQPISSLVIKNASPTATEVVIASEPATFDVGDWYRVRSGDAILVDAPRAGASNQLLTVKKDIVQLGRVASCIYPFSDGNQALFFNGHLFMVVDVSSQTVAGGPWVIDSALEPRGAMVNTVWGVDEVLPDESGNFLHLFCGERYLYVEIGRPTSDAASPTFIIKRGPMGLLEAFPSLGVHNFTRIEAALRVPDTNRVVFFKGNQFIRGTWNQTVLDIITGPDDFSTGWEGMRETGFTKVNTTLPNRDNQRQVWVFSGLESALMDINDDGVFTGVVRDTQRPVSEGWPSLSRFYEELG